MHARESNFDISMQTYTIISILPKLFPLFLSLTMKKVDFGILFLNKVTE